MFHRIGNRAFRSSFFAPLGFVTGLFAAFAPIPAQADAFTITSPLAERAVSGCTGVTMSSGIVDSIGISPATPTDKGNVASNGNVSLSGGNTVIYGDVSVGPAKKFTASGGSRATGTVTIATQNYDCNPIDLTAAKTALQTSNDNAKIPHTGFNKDPLIGTSHTDFSMSGGDSLTLAAGTYYFTSFNMSGGSTISLSGPVRIFCTGAVTVSGGSLAGSNGFGLHFWVSGTSKVDISSSTVKAFIYAPAAPATISSATVIGGVFANAVTISGSAHVTRLIDDAAPHLAITSPADGSNAVDLAHVLVKGTLTDDETDVSLKVNDQPVTVAADGTWQITLNFTGVPSPATVTAVATDAGGNIATQSIKIVLDHTPPVIQFWETGKQLPTDAVTQFGRDAHVEIRVTDDLSTFTYTAKLDGQAYKSLDPITAEGPHTVTAHAVDAPGNASDAQVSILIDKTAPVITLTESGQPLSTSYNRNIAIDIKVADNLTAVTSTAKLDGSDYVSGTPITTEGKHVLLVTARDNVGNPSSSQATVLVDKSLPVIAFYESNNKVDSTSARFKTDAHIEIRVTDVVSSATYTATLDGNPYKSLDAISADGWHKIVVNAVDEAGNPATATLDFLVDHNAPVVKFLESGSELDPSQLATYNRTASIEIRVTDATSKVTSTAKLNNVDYVSLTPISTEGKYTLSVHAIDEAGNVTDATLNLLIDKTPPAISFFDGTTQLDPRVTQKFRRDVSIDIHASDAVSSATFTATLDGQPYTPNTLVTAEATHHIAVHAVDTAGNTADATLDFIVDKTLPVIAFFESGAALDTTKTTNFGRDVKVEIKVTDNLPNVTYTAKVDGNDYKSLDPITADGTHVVSVHAIDAADNTADSQVSVLVDKTPPVIAFYEGPTKLDTTSRQKFNHLPSITIKVTDATTSPAFTATLDGAAYTSGTPVGEGSHTISVHATDALNNPADAKLDLLVDQTPPVVKLKEGTNDLPPSGGIYNHDLSVKADITDVSQTTTAATLDGQPYSLSVAIASEGTHTLSVTVTDELNWSTTVGSSFIVDKTPPKISVFEGTNPLSAGASFARDIVINFSAQDITTPALTATLDGAPFNSGSTVSSNGDHTLVVNGVDQANNHSDPVTITFHIDKDAPEVVLLESGQSFPQKKTFTRDVVATVDIKAATQTTSVATIDGSSYTLGQPYAPEGKHHIKVVVTNLANLSTTVEADFTIDKTPPTIKLFAKDGVEFTDNMKFAADITPVAQADDNLSKPPKVVVTLDGHELAPGSIVSEEKFHTISATATDDGGLSTTVGPYHFVIDKSGPKVTVTVDDKTLNDDDKFNKAITPKINVDDLTKTTIAATLDGNNYTPDTLISDDAKHTLVVSVSDDLGNITKLDPIHFTIDKTPPVVTVSENGAPFVSGSKYKRNVTPVVNITDLTETTTVATIDGNPWTSGQEVSSEGVHKLNITVTDELAWSTVVPEITFTIDKTPPVVKTTESDAPLVDGQIFNRDARPKITVTDTTATTVEATLDGQPFTSESVVSTEGNHTLSVKVTDELGFVTTVPPVSFVVDKTPPVVTIIESGKPFADNSLLNHNALPHANIIDVTATTVTAKLDGADYTLDTAIPVEGQHALDVSVKDAAGWVTTVPTIHFFIDKTPPVIAVTESGNPLVSGAEFNRTIKPNIKITDISATTVDAKLDGQPFTSDTDIAAEGEHTLTVTATDAAQWSTTNPPITFVIDKTAPLVTVKESGALFVSGSKFNRDVLPQIIVVDLTKTTIDAKLDGNAYTPDTPITTDGNHTLNITVTDHLGQATVVPPIAFTLDKTPPVVAITESGKTLATGAIFSRTIKPEISIQDLTQTTTVALLDDKPFTFGADIADEGRHTLNVAVTDDLGWTTTVPPIAFAIDKTPPDVTLVEDNKPFTTGSLFNRDVKPEAVIKDTTDTTTTATLDGKDFTLGTTITAEGQHTLVVKVTDSVGLTTAVDPVVFTIDKTAPSIAFITPAPNSTISTASIVVTGDADDAVTVDVNGVPADVDTTAKKFTTSAPLDLQEGENTLVATATDKAGNTGSTTAKVFVDSFAPKLTIISPAANACLDATQVEVKGTANDASTVTVKVKVGDTTLDAPLAADKSFSATIQTPNEGKLTITIEATDIVNHVASTTVPITIDRTKPAIEVTESGKPFTGTATNHPIALFVRAVDADTRATLDAKLDGVAYVTGTLINTEGAHQLRATATDCAGHVSDEKVISFTLDFTAPQILTLNPANGAALGAVPPVSGTTSADAVSVSVDGTSITTPVANGAFAFASLPIVEGTNTFVLVAADAAGNQSRTTYAFTVKTTAPSVTISENGSPIANNAVYRRAVTPVITSNEPDAHISATLNGAAFTSGTAITADGSYTITATASDKFNHTSPQATATFKIDRTAPTIKITSPAAGALINAETVSVTGTVSSPDIATVSVNGVTATLGNGTFTANNVALDLGTNVLLATAIDKNGNVSNDSVEVTRGNGALAIILTAPADKTFTNHPVTTVAGQVLTPSANGVVKINSTQVSVDQTGAFRKTDFALVEGDNAITASVTNATNQTTSVTVHVTGDFTPPVLKVTADGVDLANGARFATSPTITLTATDANAVTTTLTVDGNAATAPVSALANGGHALTAIARDAAGNETRVDRTFVIGASGSTGAGCSLTSFDPTNGSSVYSDTIKLSGRAGGASNVLVNGHLATMADGSFATTLTLQVGRDDITIACADANGAATTDAPSTLTLYRYTDATITITSPANDAVFTTDKITVTGTVSDGVTSGDVNGVAFTPQNGTYTASNVPLANGLNILTARAKTSSGRLATASVRVKLLAAAPQIAITSPLPGTQTGANAVDVTGTYANVDPSTITINGLTAATHAQSDTTGTFTAANVALTANATTTITAIGRNRANVSATSTVDVQNIAGAPSITITAPVDNTYYRFDAAQPDPIIGTIAPIAGSVVQINGNPAALDANNNFTSAATFATSSTITPVVARVTTPDGQSASDAIRLVKLSSALAVVDTFPAANAVAVDPGTMVVVLFSNPLDGSTASGALRLLDATNAVIDGEIFVDKDSISFAPVRPLTPGMTYTLTIAQTLKDLAGGTLASPYTLVFSVAASAPATPPALDQSDKAGCFSKEFITGHASVAGARLRLDLDGVTTTTTAGADKSFRFDFTLSGQSGFHIARIHEIGADGTLSPEAAVCYRVNCAGPQVLSASLDRNVKKLTIQFSKPMNASTLTASPTGTIQLAPSGGAAVTGTVSLDSSGMVATVTTSADLSASVITLVVKKEVQDTTGLSMAADYVSTFTLTGDTPVGTGQGYVSGAVYDATNGRPLPSAQIDVLTPINAFNSRVTTQSTKLHTPTASSVADDHGRYTRVLAEGAYTIQASASGYTTVWRQIVVPAGVGIVPIDIRLTKRGTEQTANGAALTLTNGGDTTVTRQAQLALAAASLANGKKVALTSVGGQSLAGLLPLGWSPLAAAEIAVDSSSAPTSIPGAKLTFTLSSDDVTAINATTQTLSLVQYDSDRDEWRVVTPVAVIASGGATTFDLTTSGNYALVYADKAANVAHPTAAHSGAALAGVANPCTTTPDVCRLTSRSFTLNPSSVLPSGRTTATLVTDGAAKSYPSGTAVQAYIDEQLNLADGRVLVDPPFATDLLVYRNLAGDSGVATFHLAPTSQAAAVTLRDGVDHIRVVDYPGRIDRGSLIGSEGGRVPGDDTMSIDIPAGATTEALHASMTPLRADELAAYNIAGFHVAAGFTLALTPSTDTQTPEGATLGAFTLLKPARGTFTINGSTSQVIVAEVLGNTPFGALVRLAALTTNSPTQTAGARVVTTKSIDAALFPVDGIIRDGRYLILTADNPIAFTWGQVRTAANGPTVMSARVTAGIGSPQTSPLGVVDYTRAGGTFALPVAAKPAATFSLIARTQASGDSAAAAGPKNPDADEIVPFGTLLFAAQPPHLVSFTPADGSTINATDAFLPTATFDAAIDPSSATAGIVVNNLTSGAQLAGTVSVAGNTVTFHATDALAPSSTYMIALLPSIRGANGAPFGVSVTRRVTTRAVPSNNTSIHPDKIHITIPDEHGKSTIFGDADSLPAGAQAVAVRRGRYFITAYQTTIVNATPFSFDIGTANPADAVTTADSIDLHVIDAVSRATIAIIPLTPFEMPDHKGFLSRPDETTTFTSADGITVTVPAGAFDKPTLVRMAPAQKADFVSVPSFDDELNFATAVDLSFDGVAKKSLEIEIPIPAGLDTNNRQFVLGHLGESIRGPRVMITDTLSVANGKFTTRDTSNGASNGPRVSVMGHNAAPSSNTLFGEPVKKYLMREIESGKFTVVDFRASSGSTIGWGILDGLNNLYDVFMDMYHSLYASQLYLTEGHGRIVVPIASGKAFTIEGVDTTTGLSTFSKTYDPLPSFNPGDAVIIPTPDTTSSGPYPVFGTPFRIETIDLQAANIPLQSIRDFDIQLSGSSATIMQLNPPPNTGSNITGFQVLNVSNGAAALSFTSGGGVGASLGNRLVLLIPQNDVDPNEDISVTFNVPIKLADTSSDDAISDSVRQLVKLQQFIDGDWKDISSQPRFSIDSGNRRILVQLQGELQRGRKYRLRLDPTISEVTTTGVTPRYIGQTVPGSQLNDAVYLPFSVREPKGSLTGPFDIPTDGSVRDLALDGNVLFVSALSGGLQAYDVTDPATLNTKAPMAVGLLTGSGPGTSEEGESWAVAVDHHGRIFNTQFSFGFGALRTFRMKDFIAGGNPVMPISSTIVSWRPGVNVGLPLGTDYTLLTDRPEATPRKIQIALIDDKDEFETRDQLDAALAQTNGTTYVGAKLNGTASDNGDFKVYSITIKDGTDNPYPMQTATIENVTLGLRWTKDVIVRQSGVTPAVIDDVIVRAGDKVRITRNRGTYAVISLFGYGVGVYDVNVAESNTVLNPLPSWGRRSTFLGATNGRMPNCSGMPDDECTLNDLTFSPESIIVASGTDHIDAYALQSGAIPSLVHLATDSSSQGQLSRTGDSVPFRNALTGYENPTLKAIHDATSARKPFVNRFNSISLYESDGGNRYAIVAGGHYGLLVIDITGGMVTPTSIVDDIWTPAGAYGVRVMNGTHYATVMDGKGRTLLVDLSRVDESADVDPATGLFPTMKKSIQAGMIDAWDFGTDDPRIVWKSEDPPVPGSGTTLAPVADPELGIVYMGNYLSKQMNVFAALDPRMRVLADLGNGAVPVGAIVPLGIKPPDNVLTCATTDPNCRASLAAFRAEVSLPGGITATPALNFAIESERIPGVTSAQTPTGFPYAHYRSSVLSGPVEPRPSSAFTMTRVIPQTFANALRFQKGYNRFQSPWVVAIADPRASKDYTAANSQQKKDAGCESCDRPQYLVGNSNVLELWSNGRTIRIRPEQTSSGIPATYDYLKDEKNRLVLRFNTIMADLSRPADDKLAAQNPAPNGAQTEDAVHLHDGEAALSGVDMFIRGRGALDFSVRRAYSSAVFYLGSFGRNFDSPILARVRPLPNGDADFFDGTARILRFKSNGDGTFAPPAGIFLDMSRQSNGNFVVTYPDRTLLTFDKYGRLAEMSDRNRTTADGSDGNTIHFLYGSDALLKDIIDATGRRISIAYWSDRPYLIHTITDFDGRVVTYDYDAQGHLTQVTGPDPGSTMSAQMSTSYDWNTSATPGELKSFTYQSGQITADKDGLGRTVRTMTYATAGKPWAVSQLSSGGGTWSFTPSGNQMLALDPRNNTWKYEHDDFGNITTATAPPVGASPSAVESYSFDSQQRLTQTTHPLGDSETFVYGGGGEGKYRKNLNVGQIIVQPRTGSSEQAASMTLVSSFQYGAANLPTSIHTPDGGSSTIVRDARGNPSAITNPQGMSGSLTYDAFGLLQQTNDPQTGTTTYQYEPSGTQMGYLKSKTTSDGMTNYTVDNRGNVTQLTDPSGHSVQFTINKIDQLEKLSRGPSQTSMSYDAAGQLTTRSALAGFDSSGNQIQSSTTMSIDEVGRLHNRVDDGKITQKGYDAEGNLTSQTMTGDAPKTFGYDARNRIQTATNGPNNLSYTYDDDNDRLSVTDARGNVTQFASDGFGAASAATLGSGLREQTNHDVAARRTETRVVKTLPDGKEAIVRWEILETDALGRTVRDIRKLFTGTLLVPATGDPQGATDVVTQFVYDDTAHTVTMIDPRGNRTLTEMDERGRVHRITDAAGNRVETTYRSNGARSTEKRFDKQPDGTFKVSVTTFDYDELGRMISQIDNSDPAHPLETHYGYDLRGNIVLEIDPQGRTTVHEFDVAGNKTKDIDPNGGETKYKYDNASRLIEMTDANGHSTTYTYDDFANVTSIKRPDGATWTLTYDQNQNRKTITDPNGNRRTFSYDSQDRLIDEQIAKVTNTAGPAHITHTLDDLGRAVAEETDEGVKTTFAYDSLGRLLNESVQIGTGPVRTVNNTYDLSSNRTQIAYPSGLAVTREFDALNRIAKITDGVSPTPLATYEDVGLRLLTKALPNGLRESWSYDPLKRLTGIRDEIPCSGVACQPVVARDVLYDLTDSGEKRSVTRADLGTFDAFTYNANSSITHQAKGLPIGVDRPTPKSETDWHIDPAYNYTQITQTQHADPAPPTVTTIAPSVNARNQYTSFGSLSPSWDANGNLELLSGATYRYDYANRLAEIATPGVKVDVLYDARGRKVRESRTVSGTTTQTDYVNSDDAIIEEYKDGALASRYVRGRNRDEIIRAELASGGGTLLVVIPLQDEMGNVDRLTDMSGATLERYAYDAYGAPVIYAPDGSIRTVSAFGWRWLFQGRHYQPDTGLYDFGARYLSPQLGRFIQEDPADAVDLPNIYQALHGNWLSYSDPDGLASIFFHFYVGFKDERWPASKLYESLTGETVKHQGRNKKAKLRWAAHTTQFVDNRDKAATDLATSMNTEGAMVVYFGHTFQYILYPTEKDKKAHTNEISRTAYLDPLGQQDLGKVIQEEDLKNMLEQAKAAVILLLGCNSSKVPAPDYDTGGKRALVTVISKREDTFSDRAILFKGLEAFINVLVPESPTTEPGTVGDAMNKANKAMGPFDKARNELTLNGNPNIRLQ